MFECVINISEGRDDGLLDRFSRAAGLSLRDRHSDHFHNRSVFTLINTAPQLLVDVHALVTAAMTSLDLACHEGVHPRLGIVDVVPFVALAPNVIDEARELRDDTAQWIAATHQVPVFLYGPLPHGERSLPYVRSHAFKDLTPDAGPTNRDERRGAVVVGAREILVAWNLWLKDVPLERAKSLAKLVRRPGVRALGLQVGDEVQVSCNFTDTSLVTPSQVYDQVSSHIDEPGVIVRAELVGLIPRSLLQRENSQRWSQLGLSDSATIESRMSLR
ncbi:MAG: hypothetical protein HKL85_10510 [Acidimicrobiaceae bacterium]|nr:hypothetical protein [Acidimicrobiaceae bacterium]